MHGLRTEWRQVDDGEAAVSESDASVRVVPNAFSIRPTMRDRMRHPAQVLGGRIAPQRLEAEESR
jgi:hypothetical protein